MVIRLSSFIKELNPTSIFPVLLGLKFSLKLQNYCLA